MARTLSRIVRAIALLALIIGTSQPLDARGGRGGGGDGRGGVMHARSGGGGGHRGASYDRSGGSRHSASRSRASSSRQYAMFLRAHGSFRPNAAVEAPRMIGADSLPPD
jgi:hypothetical protein